jgi:hypothetical protein
VWYSNATLQFPSKRPSKWVHNTLLFCLLLPRCPPRQYGASSRPMAASSGFRCSPGHAASGNVACIASTPHHGHQNGLQQRGVCSPPPPILLGIIIKGPCYCPLPSSIINLIGVISLFVSYWPPPATIDAFLATIVAGGRARFQ